MNPITRAVFQLQEIAVLTWRVLRGLTRPPRYWAEVVRQMDVLGFGSRGSRGRIVSPPLPPGIGWGERGKRWSDFSVSP